jgi:hypothetical protein
MPLSGAQHGREQRQSPLQDNVAEPKTNAASLRSLPYPYAAMLAICSDLDETPSREVYWESTKFLNTTENTSMGRGVGLEVGNTIYFDMPAAQFSYWNTDDRGRAMLHELMRSGYVDCLHSFGDCAATRAHAGRALDALIKHDCKPEVWIDHAVAPTNFGADIMQGSGDLPQSAAYHADLTCGFGVKYVWRGRVTSVIGQDVNRSLGGLWTPHHPLSSARALAKEFVKGSLAHAGNAKYGMHAQNAILQPAGLRDGQGVFEFLRANPSWGGVSRFETAEGVPEVLTRSMLDLIVQRRGTCILYTHLGKIRDAKEPFPGATCDAFRLLGDYARDKQILVTTTRRLLGFSRALREVQVTTTQDHGNLRIDLRTNLDLGDDLSRSDLAGVTIYIDEPAGACLYINGRLVAGLRANRADHTGRASLSLPWSSLEFPLDA